MSSEIGNGYRTITYYLLLYTYVVLKQIYLQKKEEYWKLFIPNFV